MITSTPGSTSRRGKKRQLDSDQDLSILASPSERLHSDDDGDDDNESLSSRTSRRGRSAKKPRPSTSSTTGTGRPRGRPRSVSVTSAPAASTSGVRGRGRSSSVAPNVSASRSASKARSTTGATTGGGGNGRTARSRSVSLAPSEREGGVKKMPRPKPPKLPKKVLNRLPLPNAAVEGLQRKFDFPLPGWFGKGEDRGGEEGGGTEVRESVEQHVFIFGKGDMGQFGLGTMELGDIKRPRRHGWFEDRIGRTHSSQERGRQQNGNGNGNGNGVWVSDVVFEEEAIRSSKLGLGMGGAEDVQCGGMHTLAIDSEGKVWSWGINDNAALGRPTTIPGCTLEPEELETQPLLTSDLHEENFRCVRVAAGDSVSLALGDKGEIRAWGSFRGNEGLLGFDGRPGTPLIEFSPIVPLNISTQAISQIVCGADHVIALTCTGHIYLWGNGQQGQLGRKIIERRKTSGLTPEPLALRNIVLVGTGSYHSFAVDKDGKVWAWGLNSFRQTGVGEELLGDMPYIVFAPTPVDSLHPKKHGGARVVQIAGGEHHSLFLFSNGEVWGCGRCDGFEIGLSVDHPGMVEARERREALQEKRDRYVDEEEERIMKEDHVRFDGAEAARRAAEAAAMHLPLPNDYIPVPTLIPFPPITPTSTERPKIVQVAAGKRHNFAVSSDGDAYAWGFGERFQMGLGDVLEQDTPRKVESEELEGFRVLKASCGGQHSIFVAVRGR